MRERSRSPRLDRREALRVMSGAAAAVFLGCGGAGGDTSSSIEASSLSCVATPEETIGPYFVDERLNRSDLTSGTTRRAVVEGVPLGLAVRVYAVSGAACVPLSGAQVDVWHADALGAYSDEAALGTRGETFLRGYQITDDDGEVTFRTIYPGWYSSRTVHIHVLVRVFDDSGNTALQLTTQMYFDDAITDAVLAGAPYASRRARDRMNSTDSLYRGSLEAALTRSGPGYDAAFRIGLVTA
jgi:protocatechuate 3,4-dioxygenase beta subunit